MIEVYVLIQYLGKRPACKIVGVVDTMEAALDWASKADDRAIQIWTINQIEDN